MLTTYKYCPQCGDVTPRCHYHGGESITLPQGFTACGLNADWRVSAWRFASTPRGGGGALYVIDNEDADCTFSIVVRWFINDDNDEIEELFTFESFAAAIGAACWHRRALALEV